MFNYELGRSFQWQQTYLKSGLWQLIYLDRAIAAILTRVTHGTAEVNETTLGQEDDVLAVGEGEPVDLRLDVGLLGGVVLKPLDINLTVEVADVAHDGVILHPNDKG